MLVVVSPAKKLDWDRQQHAAVTEPEFSKEAGTLAGHARQLGLGKLRALMDLSDDLARLNRDRFQAFKSDPAKDDLRAALYAFAGDTYLGLDAESLDDESVAYAQRHLRILSGLYGVLRPLDGMQAYRLEMGSRLKTRRGTNLYDFWGSHISKSLNQTAEETRSDLLVNCASQEYFGAVDQKRLKPRVITPSFYEEQDGTRKMISFFAKRARGAMARFIVEHRIRDIDGLRSFDAGGYRYAEGISDESTLAFVRPEPA
ncbi:MAG: peroxide stress protein YaaA [Pseudomonadota bacterium]